MPMMSFCLLDLAAITGGKLRLGRMPPVDGELTLVRRIVVAPEAVERGDVFWCLAAGGCDAEWAFFRGALGVVGPGQSSEPWPGRFCLQIADPVAALQQVIAALQVGDAEESFHRVPELKVLQLSGLRGADIYPLTCGQSAKGQAARRCRRRAA